MASVALPHKVVGHGPHHVIGVHGWFGDRAAFRGIMPYLDTAAFTYAFVDLRGYGEARDIAGEYTIDEVAGDVLATADSLGWQSFSLIGHSMAGSMIQRVALDAPDRTNRLVGISPVPASGLPFDDQAWQLFCDAAEQPANRRAIIDLTTGNRLPASWLDAMVDHSLACSEVSAFRAYLDAWALTDFHKEIAGSGIPVLVVAGEHDPALSPQVMRDTWLAWYPNATLEVFVDAGHYSADETPLALTSVVERFLNS